MFMPLKSGCACNKHTRIRNRIAPCKTSCSLLGNASPCDEIDCKASQTVAARALRR
jgi:hypothetical protein